MLFGLPHRAGLYWILIVAAATATLAASWIAVVESARVDLAPAAIFFVIATGIAERIQVRLGSSRPGGRVVCSLSCTVLIAVVLLFPLPWAGAIAAAGMVLGELLNRRHLPKLVFNIAAMTLSVLAASAVWNAGGSAIGLTSPLSIPWIALAAAVEFIFNSGLTLVMVSFVLDLPIGLIWRRGLRSVLLANLALLAAGVPVAGLWLAYPWMLVCLAIALLAVHRAMADRVKLETQTLESLFELADILDARDTYTHGHSERVGRYAEQLAVQLNLASDRAHLTFLAGRLHDIGKCAINNEVLLKRGSLDDAEVTHMQRHPEVGSAMLAHFTLFSEVAGFVRGHHERWDGAGYPDGLQGADIPLESRIIAVVDSYDAMTTTRPYRVALGHTEAVRRLEDGAGKQWDPRVVASFVQWAEAHEARAPKLVVQLSA